MRLDGLVHRIRRQVQIARPSHSATINVCLLKHQRVFQGCKHPRQMGGLKLHLSYSPVCKLNHERQRCHRFDIDNIPLHLWTHFSDAMGLGCCFKRFNIYSRLVLRVLHMEVRRGMVIEKHPDQDAIKGADGWHEGDVR